jgi:hypothetical protein
MASLEVSPADLRAWVTARSPARTKWQPMMLPYFQDRFFWHVYVMHETDTATTLLGQNALTHGQADGNGQGMYQYPEFASHPQLAASLFFADDRQLASGTALHELMHTWANFIVPELDGSHWANSDVDGLLGGFPRGSIRQISPGRFVTGVGSASTVPLAADIEMYLAGLWPKEKVAPFHWIKNAVFQSVDDATRTATFTGDALVTVTIDDVIAQYGARDPAVAQARHNFPLLPIVITDQPLTRGDWNLYLWQLAALASPSAVPTYVDGRSYFGPPNLRRATSSVASFAVAMHQEATVELGGAAEALDKTGATCVSLPPAGDACARLQARANACQIATRACHVDDEFTSGDAACIATCAEKVTCEQLRAADMGVTGGIQNNPYTACAWECQCTKLRNCFASDT